MKTKLILLLGVLAMVPCLLTVQVQAQAQPAYLQATSFTVSNTQTTTGFSPFTTAVYLYGIAFSNVTCATGTVVQYFNAATYASVTLANSNKSGAKLGEIICTISKGVFKPAIGNQTLHDAAKTDVSGILVPIYCPRGLTFKPPSDTLFETTDVTVYYRTY